MYVKKWDVDRYVGAIVQFDSDNDDQAPGDLVEILERDTLQNLKSAYEDWLSTKANDIWEEWNKKKELRDFLSDLSRFSNDRGFIISNADGDDGLCLLKQTDNEDLYTSNYFYYDFKERRYKEGLK